MAAELALVRKKVPMRKIRAMGQNAGHGKMLGNGKDGTFNPVFLQGVGDIKTDTRTADNPIPQKISQGGQNQGGGNGFPDTSSPGNSGNKHCHKGCPTHPPGPVKHGPATDPVTLVTRGGEQAHGNKVKQVLSNGVGGKINQEKIVGPKIRTKNHTATNTHMLTSPIIFTPFSSPV